jgi:DNA polymerase epsilon subunit 1
MIRAFCQEYAETNNPFAALFVERVQRWMVGGQARLYDPLLHQLLHTMMSKVLSQLIMELKRLGSRVIFANFNQLIIVTSKTLVGNAYAYLNYVIQSINDKAPFRHLTMTPTIYWERLIWLDPANYGGILCKYDPTMEEKNNDNDETASELSMRWCLGEYLPPAIRPSFERLVSELVYQTYKANRTRIHSGEYTNTSSSTSSNVKDGDGVYREFIQRLIERKFTRHLLRLVPDIEKQTHAALLASNNHHHQQTTMDITSDYTFPVQLGTWREQRHPALEFVLTICHILELETEASHEVRVLRRNLLALLKIGEFSSESRFEDPCASIRLTQVICNYCHTCSDIDLCRDPHPTINNNNNNNDQLVNTNDDDPTMIVWRCRSCQQPLDKAVLEDQLIQLVERRVRAYQLQDLRCKRCRWIKENHLTPTCTHCAGSYELAGQPTRKTLVQQLRIFYRLANLQKLTRLADVVNWYSGNYHSTIQKTA